MTAEAAALTATWNVGHRVVTMTIPPHAPGTTRHTVIEWYPDMPRSLSRQERRQYRAGRDKALARLARELGGTIALVEI